jgi:pimeloyl-ACP methyl ester carboxylesterase
MRTVLLWSALGLAAAADAPTLSGDWQGTITFNGVSQHLAVHLKNSGADWTGSMDAIDSGVKGIPLASIVAADIKVAFAVPRITASYEGVLDAKTGVISGTWSQSGLKLPLDLHRATAAEARGPNRPQEPKPPFSYTAEDVTYENPQAPGVRLAGTFTRPKEGGPFRAVLLITGSGAQNRDEEIMGHKPFLVLSDYLTRHGIAVLRVDDRGVGESTGKFQGATTQDFATDAMAGVRYLESRSDVDKKHIGMIGHSEGGSIAPMVAVKLPEVAFIVLLAGPGVPGAQVVEDQVYQGNLLAGISPEIAAGNRDFEHKILAAVLHDPDPEKKILTLAESMPPAVQENLRKQIPGLLSPWYRYFLAYDPGPTLEQVKCPVLALNGSKDSQVSPELNLPAIEAALRKGGNKDVTVQLVPGVNHLFQTAKTGAVAEYPDIEETMSPKVLETIAAWVARH